jgi:lipoprotein signal peptidase
MKTINKLKMTILVVLSVMNLTWLQAQAPSQSYATGFLLGLSIGNKLDKTHHNG